MADDTSASIIQLHQPRPKTPAERAKAYRDRKRAKLCRDGSASLPPATLNVPGKGYVEPRPAVRASEVRPAAPGRKPEELAVRAKVAPQLGDLIVGQGTDGQVTDGQVTHGQVTHGQVTHHAPIANPVTPVTPSRVSAPSSASPWLLTGASVALAGVGLTMNGWFARSLGSSDIAGWLFLAIGVAADATALALPSCAARLWARRQRATAATAWAVWLMTFAFAVNAGLGFASVNISDVTLARASRVTPAIVTAKAELADAMASRDRECAGGVGKNCRLREQAVTDRRGALDAAMATVGNAADPQTDAARRVVAWATFGLMKPAADDFAMLRLVLLALLPQIGGILLMIGRGSK